MSKSSFIQGKLKQFSAEAAIIRKVHKALDGPHQIIQVDDGVKHHDTPTLTDILAVALGTEQCWLVNDLGDWVRITMGKGWDALSDYSTDLETTLIPVRASIARQQG